MYSDRSENGLSDSSLMADEKQATRHRATRMSNRKHVHIASTKLTGLGCHSTSAQAGTWTLASSELAL